MALLTPQYTAPLPAGFVSGRLEFKSRTQYVDAAGRANQTSYVAAINPDGSLTDVQTNQPLQIVGMGQGDPATASALDVVATMVVSNLPTPLRPNFAVMPVDTGGGTLNLHLPDINVPVIGPLPLTIQQLQDRAQDQQAVLDDTLDLVRFQSAIFAQMSLDVQTGLAAIPAQISGQVAPAVAAANAATARSDASLVTLAKTSGLGMLRATKLALDADFSLPGVGTLGTDNTTGDVYLKVAGATDWGAPITNIAAGLVDARRWVRPTNTPQQNSDGLDAAAAFSAQTGQAILISEGIPISRTWNLIQDGYRVLYGYKGALLPAGDFPAVWTNVITGDLSATVDVTGLPHYTSVMVTVSGTRGVFNQFNMGPIFARGKTGADGAVALELRADSGSIAYVNVGLVQTNRVGYPVRLRANNPYGVNPAIPCVNSNILYQITSNDAIVTVDLIQEAGAVECSANTFHNIQAQANTNSVSVIRGTGTKFQNNRFGGFVFDWVKPTPIIDMPRNQGFVRGNVYDFEGLQAYQTRIGDRDVLRNSLGTVQPLMRHLALPPSFANATFSGNQDDALFAADKRYTVTYSGPAVSVGNVNNIFTTTAQTRAQWNAHTGTSVWTVTFGATLSINELGLQFTDGYRAKRVLLEYQLTDLSWITIMDWTDNDRNEPAFQFPSYQSYWNAVAVRLTLGDPEDGLHISLGRFWMRSPTIKGQTYLETTGGNVYGNVNVFGNVYGGTNGDQLLAFYTKYPTAPDVSGTPTDLATIANGSIWYDSVAKLLGTRIASASRFIQPVLQNSNGNRPTANVGGLWFYNSTLNAAEIYDVVTGAWKQVPLNFIQNVVGATATMSAGTRYMLVNRNSAVAITLLSGAALYTGQVVTIKDVGGYAATANITITPASGTIDGAANYVINTARGKVALLWDGTNWQVI